MTDEPLAASLGEAVGRLQGVLRQHFSRAGVSLTAARTLATLRREGPKRLTELAGVEQVTQPSMSVLVARLAAQGLVLRSAHSDDGRLVMVSITAKGRECLQSVMARRDALLLDRLAALPEPERQAIASALPALVHLVDLMEDRVPVA